MMIKLGMENLIFFLGIKNKDVFPRTKNILKPNLFKYYSSKKRLGMLLIFGLVVYIHIF